MHTPCFLLSQLSQQREETNEPWLEFLDLSTLSMGLYQVAAGTTDRETHDAHDRDEVYVAISGKGRLTANGDAIDMEAGTIVYVKAGVPLNDMLIHQHKGLDHVHLSVRS